MGQKHRWSPTQTKSVTGTEKNPVAQQTATTMTTLFPPQKRVKFPAWEYVGYQKDARGEIQDNGSAICRASMQNLKNRHEDIYAQMKES